MVPVFGIKIVLHRHSVKVVDSMDLNPDFIRILLILPGALAGLTFHEAAHAWAAFRLGDPTAKQLGRLTLNPIKHLDLMGTVLIFLVHFGWAKPVPVNPGHFRAPKRDMLLVALAGPASNLVIAAVAGIGLRAAGGAEAGTILSSVLTYAVLINVALAVFNMLPVPPLDGSRIVHFFVPTRHEKTYQTYAGVAGFVLLAVILVGMATGHSVISAIIGPPVQFFLALFAGVGG